MPKRKRKMERMREKERETRGRCVFLGIHYLSLSFALSPSHSISSLRRIKGILLVNKNAHRNGYPSSIHATSTNYTSAVGRPCSGAAHETDRNPCLVSFPSTITPTQEEMTKDKNEHVKNRAMPHRVKQGKSRF